MSDYCHGLFSLVITKQNFEFPLNQDPLVPKSIPVVGTRSATDLTTWPDVVPTAETTLENVDDIDVQE